MTQTQLMEVLLLVKPKYVTYVTQDMGCSHLPALDISHSW